MLFWIVYISEKVHGGFFSEDSKSFGVPIALKAMPTATQSSHFYHVTGFNDKSLFYQKSVRNYLNGRGSAII